MRHKKLKGKFSRSPAHRRALLRNLATALVLEDQIETTLPKAKALKRVADRLVTLGKQDTLARRRKAMEFLFETSREESGNSKKRSAVHRLFTEVAPRYLERSGGYTRVVRTRKRLGDKAQLALIQFVEREFVKKERTSSRRRRVVSPGSIPGQEAASVAVTEAAAQAVAEEAVS